jgi:hypothetical protein
VTKGVEGAVAVDFRIEGLVRPRVVNPERDRFVRAFQYRETSIPLLLRCASSFWGFVVLGFMPFLLDT